jgi:hypothetical protein
MEPKTKSLLIDAGLTIVGAFIVLLYFVMISIPFLMAAALLKWIFG